MSKFNLAVLRAAEVLSNKGVGPIRLAQTVHLPSGNLHIVSAGMVEKGIMPSMDDIKTASAEISRQTKAVDVFENNNCEALVFPPLLTVKELFFNGGTLYIFLLGDLEHGIMPSTQDLKNLKDMVFPRMKRLGLKNPPTIFFPPIIKTSVIEGTLIVTLGDIARGIKPSKADGQAVKQLLKNACKLIGVKNILVIPAHGSWLKIVRSKARVKKAKGGA